MDTIRSDRARAHRRTARNVNLSLVMWLAFSAFAILIIVLYVLVQNLLINRQYREQVVEDLREAGGYICGVIGSNAQFKLDSLGTLLLTVSNRYAVSPYLFFEDGTFTYPSIPAEEREAFSAIAETVRDQLDGKEDYAVIFQPSSSEIAYSAVLAVQGHKAYLYVVRSLEPMRQFAGDMRWLSLITGLFAVVLAFVASGFVSMIIAKPVTEITEKAKELARGNYDIKFKEDYYCTEVCELSDALDYAGSEISKADKMQKELIANVSHDFKTPLTMIKAYASMIQEISGDNPEKRRQHTQVIIDESDRLTALVSDLLDLSRIRAGITEFEKTVFNLSEDVYRIAGRFEYLTETQGYTIETEVDDELYTLANRDRIGQVLYNLIGNAVNYTGEDKFVCVRLKRKGNVSRFEVTDTGRGIAPDEQNTVWDRYYRSSEMHKRPVRGTGLGLSIVKTVLDKHEFAFGIDSEVGKGSTFWVEFPEPPAEEDDFAEPSEKNKKKK